MKLSEAILDGSKHTLPLEKGFFGKQGNDILACALGAAYYALCGETADQFQGRKLNEKSTRLEVLNTIRGQCEIAWQDELAMPEYGPGASLYVLDAVQDLNDRFHISREAIADRLEQEGF